MSLPAGSASANVKPVRMGEMAASSHGDDVLTVVGLGSCVALIILSRSACAAAMAHVVLPSSSMTGGREAPPAKFADTAVPEMLRALRRLKIRSEDLQAVLVGGSAMFGLSPRSKLAGVGDRNVEAVIRELELVGVPVTGMDVGGECGRSVQVFVGECRVMSKSGSGTPTQVGPATNNVDTDDVQVQSTAA